MTSVVTSASDETSANTPGTAYATAHATVRFARPLTHVATLLTVLGAVAPNEQLTGTRYTLSLVLGGVFALIGTWGVAMVERQLSRTLFAQYFTLMSALGTAIIVISGGYAAIAVLPLLSHAALFGTVWHGVAGATGVLGVMAWTLHGVVPAERLGATLLSFASAMAFVLIFSVVYRREAYWRAESEALRERLAVTHRQLQLHAEQLEELVATRERTRIARELHDGLGHYLTAIHVQLEAARALLAKSPEAALKGIGRAQSLSRQGLTDVRQSVSLLRQGAESDQQELPEALETIVTTWSSEEQQAVFEVRGAVPRVNEAVQHALRRILQEALSNVHHHARASRTLVTLTADERWVQLDVRDDGKGGPVVSEIRRESDADTASEPRRQWGLRSMQERVEALGGELTLGTGAGQGYHVQVRVPI